MRYLRIFIFFQIKKPFVIRQPNIQVEKAKFRSKQNTAQKPRTYSIAGKGQARFGGRSSQVSNLEFQFLSLCHKPEVWCTW
jgi:biopolymer transport protein ExbD